MGKSPRQTSKAKPARTKTGSPRLGDSPRPGNSSPRPGPDGREPASESQQNSPRSYNQWDKIRVKDSDSIRSPRERANPQSSSPRSPRETASSQKNSPRSLKETANPQSFSPRSTNDKAADAEAISPRN